VFITVSREEAHARLRVAGYRHVGALFETAEIWRLASGQEVMLTPEFDGTGAYEDEMIRAAERLAGG
jgi:hypothetical protein